MVNRFLSVNLNKLSYRVVSGRCILCQSHSLRDLDLCQHCQNDLPWLATYCARCALPLPENYRDTQCGRCLRKPPVFTHCYCALSYGFPVDRLIAGFKHQNQLHYGAILSALWLKHCQDQLDAVPDALVPVPMHWRRRISRGFNQSLLIAKDLGSALNIPIYHAVNHPRASHSQQGLSAAARRKNLRQAFSFNSAYDIKGKHLAVIDDVVTTTATANTMAAILARNGAKQVDIWCLARTP
ncbi:ComF family protein [uncultured Zhongshania sp.]|uniref:ComF family protein n=1 Tax=uncultured Zhongshania sp. TaxID=1642288 RepID=UPI0025EF2E76|nr:ComF family protein [uncultured Zhongshania sp.]